MNVFFIVYILTRTHTHSVMCHYREIVHNKWPEFTVYDTVFFWHKTYLLTDRVYT